MSQAVRPAAGPNPFRGGGVRSAYSAWRGGRLVHPLEPRRSPSPLASLVHEKFRAHVLDRGFSCVGAQAALRNNTYRFGLYDQMGAGETTRALAYDICEYAL